jgi:hypothetical protein
MMNDDPSFHHEAPPAPPSSPEQLERMLAALTARTVAAPPTWQDRILALPTPGRLAVAGGVAALALALHFARFALRGDLAGGALARMAASDVALLLVAAGAAWAALRPAHRAEGNAPLLTSSAVLLAMAAPLMPGWWPGVHTDAGAPLTAHLTCAAVSFAVGGLWFVALRNLDRSDGADTTRTRASAGAGALLGLVATLLHCPLVDADHLLLGHGLTVALLLVAHGLYRRTRRALA